MIYASTACLGTPELWSALDEFEVAGIGSVELGACTLASNDNLEQMLKARGGAYLVHNYFPPPASPFVLNLASPDDATRSRSLEHVTSALELCATIGSPSYSVHGGFVADPIGHADGHFVFPDVTAYDTAAGLERFVRSVEAALETADGLGVGLLVENNVCIREHRGVLLLRRAEEMVDLLERFDTPTLGVLLDLGHLLVSAATLDFDPDEFVDAVAPRVGGIHAHENNGDADRHMPVAAGGWAASVLARPDLARAAVVVEARFPDATGLAAHVADLTVLRGGD